MDPVSFLLTSLLLQEILDSHRDEFVNYKFTFDVFLFLIRQFVGPLSSR
jgi:hypothetical protein